MEDIEVRELVPIDWEPFPYDYVDFYKFLTYEEHRPVADTSAEKS